MAHLERRREARIRSNESVCIQILGSPADGIIQATLADVSGTGLKLRCARSLKAGTLVQIEGLTHIFLGEAIWSAPEGDGFAIGIKVQHSFEHHLHVRTELSDFPEVHQYTH